MHYLFLSLAVITEVVGTSAMKSSSEFTKVLPSLISGASFLLSFFFMAMSLKEIPVGVAYSMSSGLGIVMIAAVGWFAHKESLDLPAVCGMALIVAGCVTMKLFSGSVAA
jgi:small multidrug resistance pump